MPEYNPDVEYNDITYAEDEINFKEFEACVFTSPSAVLSR
jgi:hypothetical protein